MEAEWDRRKFLKNPFSVFLFLFFGIKPKEEAPVRVESNRQ